VDNAELAPLKKYKYNVKWQQNSQLLALVELEVVVEKLSELVDT